jgi:type IV pilus assembly protein PilY1
MRLLPTSPRRAAALVALAAALAAPGAVRAANKTFSANSLIIPAQLEYQTDLGILGAYGLVYAILAKNTPATLPTGCTKPITIYWAIEPRKLSQYRCDTNTIALPSYGTYNDNDGCDLVVQSSDGVPVAQLSSSGTEVVPFNVTKTSYTDTKGPARGATVSIMDKSAAPLKTVMKYLGAPWIIDATDRQCFLSMLQSIPEVAQYHKNGTGDAHFVEIHSARASFTAPIARLLNQRPPLIGMTGSKAAFIENVLIDAGLNQITNWNAGVVFDLKTQSQLLDTTASDPKGMLNSGKYGLFWGADTIDPPTATQLANLNYFLDSGFGAYIEADSIALLENSDNLQTTTGVSQYTPNVPFYDDCNDRTAGVSTFKSNQKGDCFNYGALSQPWCQTGNSPFDGGQSSYKGYTPLAAWKSGVANALNFTDAGTNVSLATARYKGNDVSKGLVIYLAGMRFDNARIWGERMIMNSVIANVPLASGVELARSEPVGYHNTTVSPAKDAIYQGTYVQLPMPTESDFVNYTPGFTQRWMFPYTAGHLYQYDLSDPSLTGAKSFSCPTGVTAGCPKSDWDSALTVPLPKNRDIFTVLSGSANLGWQKVQLDYLQTRSGCLDADRDGKCDLAAELAKCNTAGVITQTLLPYSAADATQRDQLGLFLQQVRGFCSAHNPKLTGTPVMEPADPDCDDLVKQKNVAKLGGIDHGSPAIVGPSRYVTDAAWVGRPVVAYVGARDGMLHAFYVSGGTSWKDPSNKGLPAGVTPGQELWAFLPPSQLCNLATNNAMVDASVNVIDVFGAFPVDANGDGVIDWTDSRERPTYVRSWHTVLLGAAGLGGPELFALDVTNPVHPVLLWHLDGSRENDGRFDVNGDGRWGTFDKSNLATYATKWFDWNPAGTELAGKDYVPTDYNTTDANVLDEIKFGRYDYRNLGQTYGTAIGKITVGNASQYVAYVATNMVDYGSGSVTPLGFKGLELFAIDLISGQKLWQWERRYTRLDGAGTPIADNTIPGRVALIDADSDGSVDRIVVGDLEGHMWELSARDGRNLNYFQDKNDVRKFWSLPLFGTRDLLATGADATTLADYKVDGGSKLAQQPLTSPIGLGRFTVVRKGLEPYLLSRLAVVQGAMGVDWSVAPFEPGAVYVVPVAPDYNTRIAPPLDVSKIDASTDPRLYGVLKPEAVWKIDLGVGERVFGMPRIVNNDVIFNTAFGSFSGDITDTILEAGNLYMTGTDAKTGQATGTTPTPNQSKSFGGVVVFGGNVIVTTDSAITKKPVPAELKSDGDPSKRPFDRFTPALFKSWEPSYLKTKE